MGFVGASFKGRQGNKNVGNKRVASADLIDLDESQPALFKGGIDCEE